MAKVKSFMKQKLIKFIEERRWNAKTSVKHGAFADQSPEAVALREENARTINWVCDLVEKDLLAK